MSLAESIRAFEACPASGGVIATRTHVNAQPDGKIRGVGQENVISEEIFGWCM